MSEVELYRIMTIGLILVAAVFLIGAWRNR